jgi:hypothetical protein
LLVFSNFYNNAIDFRPSSLTLPSGEESSRSEGTLFVGCQCHVVLPYCGDLGKQGDRTAAIASFLRWRKACKGPKKGSGPPDRSFYMHFLAFPRPANDLIAARWVIMIMAVLTSGGLRTHH